MLFYEDARKGMESDMADEAPNFTRNLNLRDLLRGNNSDHIAGLELEAAALRRAFTGAETIRELFGPARALVAYWVALEVAASHAREETISQKQLAAVAHRIWSQATISRAIRDLTRTGFLTTRPNPQDGRSPLLEVPKDVQDAFRVRGEATRRLLAEHDRS